MFVLIDIDDFFDINDVFGYYFGDQVLQVVIYCMSDMLGLNMVMVCVGVDIFGVLGEYVKVCLESVQVVFVELFMVVGECLQLLVMVGFV